MLEFLEYGHVQTNEWFSNRVALLAPSLSSRAPAHERLVWLEPLTDERDVYGPLSDPHPELLCESLFEARRREQFGRGAEGYVV